MAADPQSDLIFALLAMDSYNRGYGSGIKDLQDIGNIGSWSILTTAEAEYGQSAFDTGFYAIAYKNGADTIIAYRGTDVKGLSSSTTMGGSDPLNGYGMALGSTQSSQALLAARFYRDVTHVSNDGVSAANVVLTGNYGDRCENPQTDAMTTTCWAGLMARLPRMGLAASATASPWESSPGSSSSRC